MKIFTQKMFTLSLFFALFLAACSSTESSNEAAQTTQPARQTTSTTAPQSTDTTEPVLSTTTTEPEPPPIVESLPESLCKTDFPESNTVEWAYCILLPEPVSLERAYKLDFFATSWNSPGTAFKDRTASDETPTGWEFLQSQYPPYDPDRREGHSPRLSINCEIVPEISVCGGGSQSIDDFWQKIINQGTAEGFSGEAWKRIHSFGESLGIVSRQLLQDIETQGVNQDEKDALSILIKSKAEIPDRVSLKVFPYIHYAINLEIEVIDWNTRSPIQNAKVVFDLQFRKGSQVFHTDKEGKVSIPIAYQYDYFLNDDIHCRYVELFTHVISADGYISVATRNAVFHSRTSRHTDGIIDNLHLGLYLTTISNTVFLNRGSSSEPVRLKKDQYLGCFDYYIDDQIAWEQGYIGLNQYSIEEVG